MTANEALETFTDLVNKVFKDTNPNPIKQTEQLKQVVNDILTKYETPLDTKLVLQNGTSPACRLLVLIVDKKNTGSPVILTNYVDRRGLPASLTIAEAMLATCTSPPMFSPVKVVKDFSKFEYISADLGLSNPVRELIEGAYSTFGDETTVISLVSMGCGNTGVNIAPDSSHENALVTFLKRIALDSERTAQSIASQTEKLTLYHRFSVTHGMEISEAKRWKEVGDISADTHNYLGEEEVARTVNQCVRTLKDGIGSITLGQLKYLGGGEVLAPELLELTPNYVERTNPTVFLENCMFDVDGGIKKGSKRVIVTGMGGCGKTQLVRKFIEEYGDLFVSVFFVDGSSKESIKRDLTEHVCALEGAHSQKSFEESMRFLSLPVQNGERLLVIDNVDDPNLDISAFLPKWKRGATVITSRNASHGQLSPVSHLQLDVMSTDESIELLVQGSGSIQLSGQHREAAAKVAEELGYLPIALVQAASYIFRTGCSADTYISLLRTSRERVLSDPATSQIDMRYTTAFAAFDASYSILPSKAQLALHLLSFFCRQKFPIDCIGFGADNEFSFDQSFMDKGEEYDRGRECLKEIFYSDGKWDPAEVESIISSLRSHSLVTVIPTETTRLLQMHSLVHEWARLRVPSADIVRFQDAAIRLLSCNAQDNNYSLMQYLQVHVQALSCVWETMHVNVMVCFSFILDKSGAYSDCLKLRESLLLVVKDRLGINHPFTLVASADLAATYGKLGRYTEAKALETEVIKLKTQILGDDHPDTIIASENLAVTYSQLGQFSEAEEIQGEVLKQRSKLLGLEHPDTIRASANLAETYGELGRYAEAEILKVKVLNQRVNLLGLDHPDTIRSSANLAATYSQLGRHAEAEVLFVEVLKRRTKFLGVNHPDTILASANLAATYGPLSRYGEAKALQVGVLKQRTKLLGIDHPSTIVTSANLAVTYSQLGQYTEAEVLQVEVLKQRIKLLGVDHPDTVRASANLAATYSQLGRYSETEVLQVEVLQQSTKLLGTDHPDTIVASSNLAATYRKLGRYGEAEELEVKVLKQRTKLLGVDHPDTVRASANLAATYSELCRYSEVEALQNDVLQRRMGLLGDRHPDTLSAMWWLASTYSETERYSEALELAKKAHCGYVETLGKNHPHSLTLAAFLESLTAEQSNESR